MSAEVLTQSFPPLSAGGGTYRPLIIVAALDEVGDSSAPGFSVNWFAISISPFSADSPYALKALDLDQAIGARYHGHWDAERAGMSWTAGVLKSLMSTTPKETFALINNGPDLT